MRLSQIKRFHAHFRFPLRERGRLVLLNHRLCRREQQIFFGDTKLPTVFEVRATAGKRRFFASIASESPLVIKAEIPSVPEKGKANRELLFSLEKLLCCQVELLSGATSRKKTLAAGCTKEELVRRINFRKNLSALEYRNSNTKIRETETDRKK